MNATASIERPAPRGIVTPGAPAAALEDFSEWGTLPMGLHCML
jgi:hypothetical protein